MKKTSLAALALLSFALGCAPAPALSPSTSAPLARAPLVAEDGASRSFEALAGDAPYTVLVFISADCPCLGAHLDRLRALHATYAPRGAQFFAVDSEVGASPARAAADREALALPFPVLVDSDATLANLLGAEYATYTVVADREGRIHYRGGIDSDKQKLRDDAKHYVTDALDDLFAGRALRRATGKALGCSLRKW